MSIRVDLAGTWVVLFELHALGSAFLGVISGRGRPASQPARSSCSLPTWCQLRTRSVVSSQGKAASIVVTYFLTELGRQWGKSKKPPSYLALLSKMVRVAVGVILVDIVWSNYRFYEDSSHPNSDVEVIIINPGHQCSFAYL